MITQRQMFLNHVAQTSDAPLALEIEKGKGIYLYDKEGKSYIDLIAGISVSSLGHSHPQIVDAIQKQTNQYLHTLVYGEFILSPQVQLANLLQKHLPDNLNCTYFVNSGTEATEGALKLAKRYTGRPKIISCKKAYHGSTNGSLSLMSESFFTAPFRPLLPEIHHIEFNNIEDLQAIDEHTACVIMETVRAEIGVMRPSNDYLKKVRERCTEVGALLILDEIQVGCGRTGTLFAFEQYGIVPDILLLAKAFGGGMPLGAFISSKEIMDSLTNNPFLGHITTFGGHPVCCAAGLASLKILTEQKDIVEQVFEKEALFRKMLQHEAILDVRSAGLLMAVQLSSFDQVLGVIHECLKNGLITDWFLFNAEAVRIAPPLTITEDEIIKACSILTAAIDKVCENENGK
ncbi:aspartate aminotransferase family protein [Aureispira sp. CCB-QB1]|uniref:aspartate aminotransferase family protein n=1 Tax=Aureispira sp. CCB-QB1 TaxID=1313421 RepID=UPI0006981685|nr:aspartate aminotransferase family protein [Aureispira sp. CCB-QB1]